METFKQLCVCLMLIALQAVVFHFDCIRASVPTKVQLLIQSSPLPNRDGDYKAAAIQLQELRFWARSRRWRRRLRKPPGRPTPQSHVTMSINYTVADHAPGPAKVHVLFGPVHTSTPYHTVCLSPNSTLGTRCTQKVNITQSDPQITVYKMTFNDVLPDCYNIMILPANTATWYMTGPFCVAAFTAKQPLPSRGISRTETILISLLCISVVAIGTTVAYCVVWKRMNAGQRVLPRFLRFWKRCQATPQGIPNNIPKDYCAADGPDNQFGTPDDEADNADNHEYFRNGDVLSRSHGMEKARQWAKSQPEPDYVPRDSDTYQRGWKTSGPAYQPVQQQPEILCTRALHYGHNMIVTCNDNTGCKCNAMVTRENVCQTKANAKECRHNGSCGRHDNGYVQRGMASVVQYDSGVSELLDNQDHFECTEQVLQTSHVMEDNNTNQEDEFSPPDSDSESDSQSMLNHKLAVINQRYMNHTHSATNNAATNNDIRSTTCRMAIQDQGPRL